MIRRNVLRTLVAIPGLLLGWYQPMASPIKTKKVSLILSETLRFRWPAPTAIDGARTKTLCEMSDVFRRHGFRTWISLNTMATFADLAVTFEQGKVETDDTLDGSLLTVAWKTSEGHVDMTISSEGT